MSTGGTEIREDVLRFGQPGSTPAWSVTRPIPLAFVDPSIHPPSSIVSVLTAVHIAVVTPGRFLDLIRRRVVDASFTRTIAIDEADKLLSDTFLGDVETLLAFLPKPRQIMLFSATFPATIRPFVERHLHEPQQFNLMDSLTLKVSMRLNCGTHVANNKGRYPILCFC